MNRITVLLAEDHALVRECFRNMIEVEADLELVGEPKDGHEAVAMAKELHPAVVVMDVAMPLLNGVQAMWQILQAVPTTKVLMLSAYDDESYVQESVKSGAMGFLIKQASFGSLCHAIRELHQGNTFFSPSIPNHLRQPNGKGG